MEGSTDSKEKLDEATVGDSHYARYRVVGQLTKSFWIERFPVDEHMLTIAIESGHSIRERLLFVPDTASTAVSSRASASASADSSPPSRIPISSAAMCRIPASSPLPMSSTRWAS